jgi:hypothetical protein
MIAIRGGPLEARDYSSLAARWIDTDMAGEQFIRRVDSIAGAEVVGRNGTGDYSGLLIPYVWPGEDRVREFRLRRDHPDVEGGKLQRKYLTPPGRGNLLYIPVGADPRWLADVTLPMTICEGEFKAISLFRAARHKLNGERPRYLPVALSGVWNFRSVIGKSTDENGFRVDEKGIIPDFSRIQWEQRLVTVIFDRDVDGNDSVSAARAVLTKELQERGALVRWFQWPPESPGAKGIDDLLSEIGPDPVLALIDAALPRRPIEKGDRAWRNQLISSKDQKGLPGGPKPILANAVTALRAAPEWAGVLGYNEFSLFTETRKPAPWQKTGGSVWSDYDDSRLSEWLAHHGIFISSKLAAEAVQTVSMESRFNPVHEYLRGLEWDGDARLDSWLTDYLGAPDTPYTRATGACWMISACARVFQPGCQADYTLVLEGEQGVQKSSALRVLAGDRWFADHISDLNSKDARIELHGVWIFELGELARIRGSANAKVKNFLTARTDHFRPPYARRPEFVPRSNVFAATTNDSTPFSDETGNRRFWPVRCGEIDIAKLTEDRSQLWAEAYRRYTEGAIWYLDSDELNAAAEAEQDERYDDGVWDDVISRWLAAPVQRFDATGHPVDPFDSTAGQVTVTDVLVHAIGKRVDQLTYADRNQVARCLTHKRWRRRQIGSREMRQWFYVCPYVCPLTEVK